ncbi:uncharacterized protein LOC117585712 isoform X2 [Drosophila guanche]|uniref:uncharacterized protein LOC117585712 isoform X2 n=1 Tax=Drosophila guanche TaxID=7266 RepID=UPI00147160BD|nr:uncharacterized protein LOC117585712 isoform X2 [Drosophila guanche]
MQSDNDQGPNPQSTEFASIDGSALKLVEQPHSRGSLAVSMKSDQIIDKIRNKLKESDPGRRTVVNTFQFNFTDADGKLIKSMALNIYEGSADSADGQVTISDEDFYLVGTKQKTFQEILQQDKATIEGDEQAINKMLEKFRINSQN